MNDLVEKQETQVAAITPMSMLNVAMEKGASLEQMQQLMDLQERWEKNEARKAYVSAMSQFRAKCPAIAKTKETHNSKYAGLAETIDTIKDLLSACGLSHSWRTNQEGATIAVTCCVTHEQGHSECTTLSAEPDKTGSKNSIQAIASTVSYLERYTLYAILGLASKEMDNDGNVCVSLNQAMDLKALAEEVGADIPALLKYFKVAAFEELPANQHDNMINALEAKRKQKK